MRPLFQQSICCHNRILDCRNATNGTIGSRISIDDTGIELLTIYSQPCQSWGEEDKVESHNSHLMHSIFCQGRALSGIEQRAVLKCCNYLEDNLLCTCTSSCAMHSRRCNLLEIGLNLRLTVKFRTSPCTTAMKHDTPVRTRDDNPGEIISCVIFS